jgi:D-3-phosphoglycerate dehydrogenase
MPTTIVRQEFSGYFSPDFKEKELLISQKFPDTQYINSLEQWDKTSPLIYLSNTQTNFSDLEHLCNSPLSLIIHPNSGYDNIPKAFVEKCSAPIILGNQIRAQAVSEAILMQLFQMSGSLPQTHSWDNERKWPRTLLNKRKILIVGYGPIGQMVHQSLQVLCPNIQILDPFEGYLDVELKGIDTLILCCSLSQTSKEMINRDFLSKLSAELILINTARGDLIIENDLIQFLSENENAQAYLDVFSEEPAAMVKFKDLNNITLSSHIAGVHDDLEDDLLHFEEEVLNTYFNEDANLMTRKYNKFILQSRMKSGLF